MRLREERGVQYAIRIPANKSLELEIEVHPVSPAGKASPKPLVRYKSFHYQAAELVAGVGGSSLRSSITRASCSRASDSS